MLEQPAGNDKYKALFVAAVVITTGLLAWAIGESNDRASWYTTRSAGIIAYILLTLSTLWGLLTSSRVLSRLIKPPVALELHKAFSFAGIGAVAIHGIALLFDRVVTYSIWQISVPFVSSYRPVSVAAGVFAGYLILMLSVSFYMKKQIGGPKIWRTLHYLGFVAFALGSIHGVLSGTDSGSPFMVVLYTASICLVLFLTYIRVLGGRYIPKRRRRVEGPPRPAQGSG